MLKNKKILIVLVLAITTGLGSFRPVYGAEDIEIELDGETLDLGGSIIRENGRVFLPIRKLGELLGLQIDYKDKKISIRTNSFSEPVKPEKDQEDTLTYSNLLDLNSQKELRKAMSSAGFLEENIEYFFQEVNTYNKAIEGVSLVEKGFSTIDSLEPEYDLLAMIDLWNAQFPEFIGYNCRLTSYGLMKDSISIGSPDTSNTDHLPFDKNALEYSPKEIFTPEEEDDFLSLFSYIPAEDTKDIEVHLKNIQEDWKKKEISFQNEDKRSLISVFFHDEEGYLFIGHMGVLIPREKDLLFIEKLSFQEPYQLIKFGNRKELNTYLMNKYDISWGQETAKPFIMENDQLLEE